MVSAYSLFKYSTARLLAHSLNKTAGDQHATPARQNVMQQKYRQIRSREVLMFLLLPVDIRATCRAL